MNLETKTLPDAMQLAAEFPCMWCYVNQRPVPLWWKVVSYNDHCHKLQSLYSLAGIVPILTTIGYAEPESRSDMMDILHLYCYRAEPHPCRPPSLVNWNHRSIHISRRHEYAYTYKPKRERKQASLFDDADSISESDHS